MTAKSDAALITQAQQIKNETLAGANTADRVGTLLQDIVESKINVESTDYSIPVDSVGPSGTDYFDLNTRDFRCGTQAFAVAQTVGVYHYKGRNYDIVAAGTGTAHEAYSFGWLTARTGTGTGNTLGIYAGNAPVGADAVGGSLILYSGDPDGSNYFGTIEFHIGRAAGHTAGYWDEFGLTLAGVSVFTVEAMAVAGNAYGTVQVDADGTFHVLAPQAIANTTVALAASTGIVFVDNSTATVTINLPAPSGCAGRNVPIYIGTSPATHNVVLHRNGSEKIDGASADKTISSASTRGLWLACDGTDWYTMAANVA